MRQDTYHMLWSSGTNRIIIHTKILPGYNSQRTVRASCWIDAKKKLGFDLTPLQEEMLNAKNNSTAPHRGVVVNLKDARTKLRSANGELPHRGEAGTSSRQRVQQLLRDEGLLSNFCLDGATGAAEEVDFD